MVLVIGVLMAAIDATIVVLALPTIDEELHANIASSIWIIMVYILVITVLSTQVGKLGDRFGRAKLYNYGLGLFVIGSALCGLSPDIYALIGFRAVQAVGGALVGTSSSAVVSDNFKPNERGKAFGFTSLGWNLGSIFGIFLGGLLATIDWRLIFLINVPIGIALLPISIRRLKDAKMAVKEKFDVLGSLYLGIALLLLTFVSVISLSEGLSLVEYAMLALVVVFALLFILHERHITFAVIDLKLFKNRVFSFSVLASMLQFTANFAVIFILILYLQGVRSQNPFIASIYLLPGYIIGAFVGPNMGKLSDKIGARIPASIGLLLIGIGYAMYIIFLSVNSPLYYVSLITILTGIGSGMFFPSNTSAVMANAPKDNYGMASGINRTLGNVGMVLSFVLALTVISISIPRNAALAIFLGTQIGGMSNKLASTFIIGLHAALLASIVMIGVAIAMSLARGKEDRNKVQEEPLEMALSNETFKD
ncbi:MAG: MFS transporter [Candidatus Micrarchaeaceae archaeon]